MAVPLWRGSQVRRLLAAFALVVVLVFPAVSMAEGSIPGQSQSTYTATIFGYQGAGGSAGAACTAAAGAAQAGKTDASNKYTITITASTESSCTANVFYQSCNANPNSQYYGTCDSGTTSTTTGSVVKTTTLICPAHASGSSSCTCDTGYSPGSGGLSGMCVPPTVCPVGSTYSTGWYDIGTDVTVQSTAGCTGGCAYSYDGGAATKVTLESGVKHYWAKGTYTSTGSKCGGGDGDPTNAAPPPAAASAPTPSTCPAGQALGSVNGNPVCAPTGSPSPASGVATGTPDSPKSTTTTGTTSTTNADGSVTKTTTTTTTSATGSVSTSTTVTTTKTDGSSTSVTTTTGAAATGSGAGTGSTSTGGAGCDPATGTCGEGFPTISDIYTKKEKTLSSVLTSAKDAFMAAPAIAGAASFMSVSGAGACPQSSWHIPYLNADVAFDFFCTATAISMYAWMRAAVLVAFAVLAFRVAFL